MTNTDVFAGLEPRSLWEHFASLCRIPRPSGHEEQAVAYIISWATARDFEVRRDETGNLVVWVPGTPGHECAPPIVLQGHLDIVCERDAVSPNDAEAGRIQVVRDGDWLRAVGTTLGADNGIGVAAMLCAAEDANMKRGPLDLLFTVDEEVGLTGATHFDPSLLRGRVLLNLDTEDDGVLCVGCAGGGDTRILLEGQTQPAFEGWTGVHVAVSGLKGGHSGTDINKNHANAIRTLVRILRDATNGSPLALATIHGGNKRNAIPRECQALVYLPDDRMTEFREGVARTAAVIASQFQESDNGLCVTTMPAPKVPAGAVFGIELTRQLFDLLLAAPTGALAMSQVIPGLVETSTNLAVVHSSAEGMEVVSSSRSSNAPALRDALTSWSALARLVGAKCDEQNLYPGWQPNLSSRVLTLAKQAYHRLYGEYPVVTAVHAGLECGLIGERIPGMDMVSFGPQITGAHAPGEQVHVPSVGRFWNLLAELLHDLAL